jgi:heavy metal translocating P-type ATPase
VTRRRCDHCGLPLGPGACFPSEDRAYCCRGCALVARLVGARGQEGLAAWVLVRFGVGGFLALNIMMISLLLYYGELRDLGEYAVPLFRWGLLGLSVPALLILGPPFLSGALRGLRRGRADMDTLIALGAGSAFGVSAVHVWRGAGPIYFDTATMLLLLVTLGRLLEASAKNATSRLVHGLLDLQPAQARRLGPEGEQEIPLAEVRAGDRLRVRPGERLPADGVVLSGRTSVHEAAFTGEPLPRRVGPGDSVLGGAVNGEGLIVVEARGVGEGSLLARIVRLVEEAAARPASRERLAERLSAYFIPLVVALAAGALLYWGLHHDLARGGLAALSVLVVACPCALGLATPLVTTLALGRAAREGVLIRSGEALETLPRLTHLFLDKTGTLTRGSLSVVEVGEVLPLSPGPCAARDAGRGGWGVRPEDATRDFGFLATLESAGEHPLARAIVAEADRRGLALGEVLDYQVLPGQGAEGTVILEGETRKVIAGTAELLTSRGYAIPSDPLAASETRVYAVAVPLLSATPDPLLSVTLSDSLRPEAAEAVAELRRRGLALTMLSGDRPEAAQSLAQECGLTEVLASCTPDLKLAALREARGRGEVVGMVGDGLNDAPALAAADLGLAVAGASDLALESAQVTLLGGDLRRIPWTLDLARRSERLVRQNLAWAFGYNGIALIAAFFGYLHPLLAAAAMLGSSLFVLANSLRLSRFPAVAVSRPSTLDPRPLTRDPPSGSTTGPGPSPAARPLPTAKSRSAPGRWPRWRSSRNATRSPAPGPARSPR